LSTLSYRDPNVSVKAICLLSGYYILVPKSQEAILAAEMPNLVMQDGYLIQQKDAGSKMPPDQRVNNAVPNLTYASLHVDVKPSSSFASSGAKSEQPNVATPTDDSSVKSSKPSNGQKKGTNPGTGSNETKLQ